MTLQLHKPDGEGGLTPAGTATDDHRTQLRAARWGSSLRKGKLPRLANTEMDPTPAWLAIAFWGGLAFLTFVLIVVGTVLFGKKLTGGHKLTFPLFSGGGTAVSHYGGYMTPKLPGTAVLVAIFFVSFVLYYFINWKYLSELWLFR